MSEDRRFLICKAVYLATDNQRLGGKYHIFIYPEDGGEIFSGTLVTTLKSVRRTIWKTRTYIFTNVETLDPI